MYRLLRSPTLVVALALVPALALADTDPAECKDGASMSCDQQQKCLDARFKAVLSKDPTTACAQNNKAEWDKTLSSKLPGSPGTNAVCAGTYVRLQTAVNDYKTETFTACKQKDYAKSCVGAENVGEGNAAMECAAKVAKTNIEASQRARAALEKAREEAGTYKRLTQEVKKMYLADVDKIQDAEGDLRDKGVAPSQIAADKARAGTLSAATFSHEGTEFIGPVDVSARNGGANNLAEYERNQKKLAQEQDAAAATIDAFNVASKREIDGRTQVETSLKANLSKDLTSAGRQGSLGSTITGTGGGGGSAKSGSNNDSSDSTSSLLKNAASLTSLASAGASLAGAMNKNSATGSSSSPPNYPSGETIAGSTTSTPQAIASSSLGDGPSSYGAPGTPDAGSKSGHSSPPERFSAVDGSTGGGRLGGSVAGSVTGSGNLAGGGAGGTFMPGGGAGTGSAFAGIKDDGRDPASAKGAKACNGADCAAMGDLKTEQFNAGGSLGVPKIGAPDPALATKGALDSMFGPLPALDSLIPKDAAVPGLQGVLSKMDQALLGAAPRVDAQDLASEQVAPANSRSLFDRVHTVHEVALKRGSVALYHKKL